MSSTGKYLSATSFLFPSLLRCITQSYERDITRRCLGIFTKLTSIASNTFIFSKRCSDSNLLFLTQLLYTNITLTESIRAYYPPSLDSNQSDIQSQPPNGLSSHLFDRLPACSCDFNEVNDLEIRDMVLDALRTLCSHPDINVLPTNSSLSIDPITIMMSLGSNIQTIPSLKERIASQPLCLEVLISILMMSSGKIAKNDGFHRALSLLSLLSMHPKNHSRFLIVQKSLFLLTISDDVVAGKIFPLLFLTPSQIQIISLFFSIYRCCNDFIIKKYTSK